MSDSTDDDDCRLCDRPLKTEQWVSIQQKRGADSCNRFLKSRKLSDEAKFEVGHTIYDYISEILLYSCKGS